MTIFEQQIGNNNPFDDIDVGIRSAPTFVDIDGDGDLDAIVGAGDGTINLFENIGDANTPSFIAQTGNNNPFNGINVGNRSTPALADIDGDGDLDAIIGIETGPIFFFENIGDANTPNFVIRTRNRDPLTELNVAGLDAAPTFADIDGDGDLDAVVGDFYGYLNFFENIGDANTPNFTHRLGSDNPLAGVFGAYDAAPTFADIDGDGDLDAIVGGVDGGPLSFAENIGDANTPEFRRRRGLDNPFNDVEGFDQIPTFADIDGDGDLDAIVGVGNGSLNFYLNESSSNDSGVSLNELDINNSSNLNLIDIDGDGDLDLVARSLTPESSRESREGLEILAPESSITFFENVGDENTPSFIQQVGHKNPFEELDIRVNDHLTFADIDGDGDLDGIAANIFGTLQFFENTGSDNTPIFTQQTGANNPFNDFIVPGSSISLSGIDESINFVNLVAHSLIDLDGDQDLDLVLGRLDGTLNFFENTGDESTPVFTPRTGAENPFENIDVGLIAAPTFIDIDSDGDLDAIVGDVEGTLNVFENTGDVNNPIFVEQTGLDNPFNGIDVGIDSQPTLADIDGDGDIDLLVGANSGTLNFFENTGPRETEINFVDSRLIISDVNGGNSADTLTLTETENTLHIEDLNQTFQVSDGVALNSFNRAEISLEPIQDDSRGSIFGDGISSTGVSFEPVQDDSVDRPIFGGGSDNLFGGAGNEPPLAPIQEPIEINTLAGNDVINADIRLALSINTGDGQDTVLGGQGDDILNGGQGHDSLNGENGDDTLNGGSGEDTLNGSGGEDILLGDDGNDRLAGNGADDTLLGGRGDDTLLGGNHNDSLVGGDGNDRSNGGIGNDILLGGLGNDRLAANGGDDILTGGGGNDHLMGNVGSNVLNGTDTTHRGVNERDTLMGGRGADQFVLGDSSGAYYLDEADGSTSFAQIRRFDSLDTIVLSGSIGDYRIETNSGNSTIFRLDAGTDDAIAVIENTVGLNLNSDQFSFV